MVRIDHTAAIFEKLGITPETQPKFWRNREAACGGYEDVPVCYLTHGTLASDGLAVRLVALTQKITFPIYLKKTNRYRSKYGKYAVSYCERDTFAAAVHDALVEVLGIGEETL